MFYISEPKSKPVDITVTASYAAASERFRRTSESEIVMRGVNPNWMFQNVKGKLLILSACCILAGASMSGICAFAQVVNSSVEGTVTDSSGAGLVGAQVNLVNTRTGVTGVGRTDRASRYAFPSVQPGFYTLQVTKAGFQTYLISEFELAVAQRAELNAVLPVGSASESVTVTASAAALLDSGSNDLGSLIERTSVQELPLNGRNFLSLGLLSGAVQPSGGANSDFAGNQGGHPGGLSINVGGQQEDLTTYLFNGVSTSGSRLGNVGINLSIGAIEEFKIHYGFFMPDLGVGSGIVDVITKSGTNTLHGEVFEFFRDNNLEARSFFSTTAPQKFIQNQFGADAGGPILHNKLFVFGNYEGFRQIQSLPSVAFTPDSAMFGGNFSELSVPLYNPFAYDPVAHTRVPFPGNIIPANLINPVSVNLLKYYTAGSSYGARPNNLVGTPRTVYNYDQFTARGDYTLNARNNFTIQYSHENSPYTALSLFPLGGTFFPQIADVGFLQWNTVFKPNVVNELRVAFSRTSIFDQGERSPGIQQQIGLTGSADQDGIPSITFAGFTGFGQSRGLLGNVDNSYQLHDAVSWLRGNHQIKFGGDLAYIRAVDDSGNAQARSQINFTGAYTAQTTVNAAGQIVASTSNSGNSFADFLLGMPLSGNTGEVPPTHVRWTNFQPYVQDSWKAHDGLTLNMGLGWFVGTPPNTTGYDNRYPHVLDLSTGLLRYALLGQISTQIHPTTWTNFAPRFGVVYQPIRSQNTVFRGGFGLYYTTPHVLDLQYQITGPGVSNTQAVTNPQLFPTLYFGHGFLPQITIAPITQNLIDTVTGTVNTPAVVERTTYVIQYNFNMQTTFAKHYSLDLGYIGSGTRFLNSRANINDCSSATSYLCSTANILYPRYSPQIIFSANNATASYNALVVKFQRQFSGGLSVLANYTWSKALTDGMEGGASNTLSERAKCLRCDRGPAAFDIPQSFVVSTVWDLPFGHQQRFLSHTGTALNELVGGWGADFIVSLRSGIPFDVTAPNSITATVAEFRADRVCNGRAELQNKNIHTNGFYWFNPSCFKAPAPGYFGNSPFDPLHGPGVNTWDVGLHKEFSIQDRVHLQFRAEAFNAFNHAQFLIGATGTAAVTLGQVVNNTQIPGREIQFGLKLLW